MDSISLPPIRPLVPRWRYEFACASNDNPIPYLLQEIQRKLLRAMDTEQTIQQGQDVIFNNRYIGQGL